MTRSVTKRQEAYEAVSLVVAGDRAVGNSRGTIIATTGAAPTPRAPNELSVRELFERFRLENEIGFEWAWESSGFARGPAPDLGPGRSPLAAAAERIASAGQASGSSPSRLHATREAFVVGVLLRLDRAALARAWRRRRVGEGGCVLQRQRPEQRRSNPSSFACPSAAVFVAAVADRVEGVV
jgi:hypothetical protein